MEWGYHTKFDKIVYKHKTIGEQQVQKQIFQNMCTNIGKK